MCSHQPVGNAISARGFNLESHSWTFSPKQSSSVTNSLEIAHIPFQQQLCHLFLTLKGLCRKTGLFHGCRVCLGRLLQTQGKSNSASPDTSDEGMKAPSPWNWGPITSKTGTFEAFGYLAKKPHQTVKPASYKPPGSYRAWGQTTHQWILLTSIRSGSAPALVSEFT